MQIFNIKNRITKLNVNFYKNAILCLTGNQPGEQTGHACCVQLEPQKWTSLGQWALGTRAFLAVHVLCQCFPCRVTFSPCRRAFANKECVGGGGAEVGMGIKSKTCF